MSLTLIQPRPAGLMPSGLPQPGRWPGTAWSAAGSRGDQAAASCRHRASRKIVDIELDLDLDHSTIKLLVAEDAVIDQWDLAWTGRGQVKQAWHHNPAGAGRLIRLTGHVRTGQVRVASGGIARLSAMASREYLADARRAHAEGGMPTLDDPPGRG